MAFRFSSQSFYIIIICIVLLISGCSPDAASSVDSAPSTAGQVSVSIVDANCTSVWLKVSKAGLTTPFTAKLTLDGVKDSIFNFVGADTVIQVNNLPVGQSFGVTVSSYANPVQVTRAQTRVATLGRGSEQFRVFHTDFGHSNKTLVEDQFIVNHNDIWVAGLIVANTQDSETGDSVYNIAHWDGSNWNYITVPVYEYNSSPKALSIVRSIYAQENGKVWASTYNGNLIEKSESGWHYGVKSEWVGSIVKSSEGYSGGIYGFERIREDEFYAIGTNGYVVRYNNGQWTSFQYPISGQVIKSLSVIPGSTTTWVSGALENMISLYTVTDGKWRKYVADDIERIGLYKMGSLQSVYAASTRSLFLLGENQFTKQSTDYFNPKPLFNISGISKMKGCAVNDIWFIAGSSVYHYDGTEYHKLAALELNNGIYSNISVTTEVVVLTGYTTLGGKNQAFVRILYRN